MAVRNKVLSAARAASITALALILVAGCGERRAAPSGEAANAPLADAPQENGGQWLVAAANPYAVDAGAAVLARGGSAVDAAIAVETVLGLVEPQSSGLGGGGFMLYYDAASKSLTTYDGREVAPMSATPDRFIAGNGEPMDFYDAVAGGLSVGVPGMVRLFETTHTEHGVLPWADLFDPAIALADDGFNVSPRLNSLLSQTPRLRATPEAAAYFYQANGAPWPVGHVLKNPQYADLLRAIKTEGADAFYEGPIAEAIVEAVNSAPHPGGMTLQDLKDYAVVERAPVCGPYRAIEICSMAPPSSGGVTLLQILSLLEPFDLAAAGPGSTQSLHLLFEASKLAYADRAKYLADQDQSAADGGLTSRELIAGLLNPPYLRARATLVDPARVAETVEAGDPSAYPIAEGAAPGAWPDFADDASPEPPSTSHFVIIDAKGNVVSMTATVEFAFGSHQMASGMILNNQLTDFSFLPVRDGEPVANAVGPGKRPRSSMSPVIMFGADGGVLGALGSPGGPAIIGYVAKTLIAMIDWGMPIQQAIDAPNAVIPRGAPVLETGGFDPDVIEGLRRMGHPVMERDLNSGVHGFVVRDDGTLEGGADPRREGVWKTGTVGTQ
ncbi:MAG: gamma-glutamyltransferase [Parvularculaceae bacterium]